MKQVLAIAALIALSACAQNNLHRGEATNTVSGASSVVIPFPHPDTWKEPEIHGVKALAPGPLLARERCQGCHDLDGAGSIGNPGCKSCHSLYPHPADWGESDLHVRDLKASGDLAGGIRTQCATKCHGADLGGGLSTVSCAKCHGGYPHPAGWSDPTMHGTSALVGGSTAIGERCGGCHDLNGTSKTGTPGCKSCHLAFPHPAGWGDSSIHVRALALAGDLPNQIRNQCGTQCHGTDLAGGLSGISCNKCHTGFPHPAGWVDADSHGLSYFSNSAVQATACGSCHGASLNGASYSPSCGSCHGWPDAAAPVRHDPVSPSTCSTCHATKASEVNGAHLLKNTPPSLCWTSGCHTTAKTATVFPHSVVTSGNACMNCHAPHDAAQPKLLRDTAANVCFSCHNTQITSAKYGTTRNLLAVFQGNSNLHSPFAAGNCAQCHDVHGAANNHLLKNADPMFVIPAGANLSAFSCFASGCHSYATYVTTPSFPKPSVVQRPTSALPTQFVRIGSLSAENLHSYHVANLGYGCLACHDPHGSNDPYLLRSYLTYSDPGSAKFWVETSCQGCHTGTFPAGYPNGLW